MTSAVAVRQSPWLRYALLGAVFSALWLAISLFSAASSASADEQEPSGLLGTAGALLGGATQVTATLGDTVGGVVPVDEASTDAANTAISTVNAAVASIVNGVTGTLSEVADGGAVGAVVEPVTGTLDGVVVSVPVVGDVLGDDTLGGVVDPLAGAVDGTLAAVVGSTSGLPTDGTGVLPHLPGLPLLPGDPELPGDSAGPAIPGAVDLAMSSPAAAAAAADLSGAADRPDSAADVAASGIAGTVLPGDGSPLSDGLPPSPAAPAGGAGTGGAGPTGAGGASGTSDAALAALELDALASLVLHAVDDELPSSPVFDTDATPD